MEIITNILQSLEELIRLSRDTEKKAQLRRIINHFEPFQGVANPIETAVIEGILLIGEVREIIQDASWIGSYFFAKPNIKLMLDNFSITLLAEYIRNPRFTPRQQQDFNKIFFSKVQLPHTERENVWRDDLTRLRSDYSRCEEELKDHEEEYTFWRNTAPRNFIEKYSVGVTREKGEERRRKYRAIKQEDDPTFVLSAEYRTKVQASKSNLKLIMQDITRVEIERAQYRKNNDYFFKILAKAMEIVAMRINKNEQKTSIGILPMQIH